MADVKVPPKRSLQDRMRDATKSSSVSIMPEPKAKKKEEEPIPDLRDLVGSLRIKSQILRLTQQIDEWGVAEREAKKAKAPLVQQLKDLLAEEDITAERFMADDIRVLQYTVPRSSISRDKLLEHGIAPKIIAACTDTKLIPTLKISRVGEDEDES